MLPDEPLMPPMLPDEPLIPPMLPDEPLMPPMLPDEPLMPLDDPELDGDGMDPPPLELELLRSGLLRGEVDPQAASKTATTNAANRRNAVLEIFTINTRLKPAF